MTDARTDRTRIHRHPERGDHSSGTIHGTLDDALTCTVAWVDEQGRPRALPTIQARIGDTLYLHGSRGARAWKAISSGTEVCVTATVVDELVLARTSPHHSMNYRSVVLYGRAREVIDEMELYAAAKAITRHVLPGREDDAAEPREKDWRETLILAMPIDEASAKVRTGPPNDDPGDLDLEVWAGTLPLRTVVGTPTDAPDLRPDIDRPAYLGTDGEELPRP
jgi:nitroimidazol reductase NimA-like FMN-containing flavoprotein (pyridoxamine 5'-phosphate oxidase superfamily)